MSPQVWTLFMAFAGVVLHNCLAKQDPRYSFLHDATSAPEVSSYDYIIVGGGTAGCPLAATLSEGATVLVLERGDAPYGDRRIESITGFANTLLDYTPNSPSQAFISEDGVRNNRARVLGGGTALNAGFYTRANDEFVKQVGFVKKEMEDSYEWVERKVVFKPSVRQWQTAVREGLLEAGVLPDNGYTFEHIQGTKIGGSLFDESGHRHTAADLLEYAVPNRTTIYLHATVHKILFDTSGARRPRAHGVVFEDKRGKMHEAHLNKKSTNEIILTAGTLGSPQLLMLSGIGPKEHLQKHGLKVVLDQAMVGQGMADNPMNALFIWSPRPVEVSLVQVVGITPSGSYIETASGAGIGYQGFLNGTHRHGGVIFEKIMGPLSKGHLELRNTNPKDNPKVTFNYFSNPEDLKKCVQGMKTIIDVVNSDAFSGFRINTIPVRALMAYVLSSPVNHRLRRPSSVISLEHFCEDTVMTLWHYHGGCQVGKVVDEDYKVLGVDSLRVIDSSTFSSSPGTNPQATVMMFGRYMGLKILRERL